ncbi:MAG: triose-phosphate isomerase, partial [Gemmatimonadetes bacterium]|nr:triose-phosphate isomerase [Gemmatimonadota bacterium]NIQ56406.1 triose-phosphate isomerase [Gemmatimonadota bacterium]NIU76597.1 triose-phosphate isomerase [Gammaproteobacteria bacterium]NIX46041.1 triose-phosphate isomerase [Gemmatimonadota bacterium]NIY10362.1 triose-phosphate isomerase [Gemmatimonadota bacterium]
MADAVKTPVIAGNWKMHKGPESARKFCREFAQVAPPSGDRTLLLFPPAVSVPVVREALGDHGVGVGVQNLYWEAEGAFTGEISAPMAREAGATHALVGHSERRHVFGETDEETGRKVAAALEHRLIPVLCVGETLEQRRAGRLDEVILGQLDAGLRGIEDDAVARVLIAYEPVWAIGTGETATPEDAADAHGRLRGRLRERIGDAAAGVPILYGGSVKPHNAAELL